VVVGRGACTADAVADPDADVDMEGDRDASVGPRGATGTVWAANNRFAERGGSETDGARTGLSSTCKCQGYNAGEMVSPFVGIAAWWAPTGPVIGGPTTGLTLDATHNASSLAAAARDASPETVGARIGVSSTCNCQGCNADGVVSPFVGTVACWAPTGPVIGGPSTGLTLDAISTWRAAAAAAGGGEATVVVEHPMVTIDRDCGSSESSSSITRDGFRKRE
jgi:hypothetical protein